jgi:hypothetical protein
MSDGTSREPSAFTKTEREPGPRTLAAETWDAILADPDRELAPNSVAMMHIADLVHRLRSPSSRAGLREGVEAAAQICDEEDAAYMREATDASPEVAATCKRIALTCRRIAAKIRALPLSPSSDTEAGR